MVAFCLKPKKKKKKKQIALQGAPAVAELGIITITSSSIAAGYLC